MSDAVSEAPPAEGSSDHGGGDLSTETFESQVGVNPPLAWLAVVAGLGAMVVNQLLLPALSDPDRRVSAERLSNIGSFATNLATIAGTLALCFALIPFLRARGVMTLHQRLLVGWFGGFVFLPTLVAAVALEGPNPTQIVLFALAAAQVLTVAVHSTAGRLANTRYLRFIAHTAIVMALFGLLAQATLVLSRLEVPGLYAILKAQHACKAIGEVAYLLLLTSVTALLMPPQHTTRARAARMVGFAVLPIVLGLFYLAERLLQNDYALLLYHAQRVSVFIDAWPRLYSVPLGLALSGCLVSLIGGTTVTRQAAAGVLLLIASGYTPHTPGRLLTWTLGMVLIGRALMTSAPPVDKPAPASSVA